MGLTSSTISKWHKKAKALDDESFIDSISPETTKIPPLFTLTQVSESIGISKSTLIKLINQDDEIPVEIIGKNTRKLSPLGISKVHEKLNQRSSVRYPTGKLERGIVISCANQKGGVGKTTTCVNLAGYLALNGMNFNAKEVETGYRPPHRVLVIDLDPQGSTTSQFGFTDNIEMMKSSYALLTPNTEDTLEDVTTLPLKTNWENIDIIPSSLELSNIEFLLPLESQRNSEFNPYEVLKERIKPLLNTYSCVLIDTSPTVNYGGFNVSTASDVLLLPTNCSQASFHSMVAFLSMLVDVTKLLEENSSVLQNKEETTFKMLRVAANMFDNSIESMAVVTKLQQVFGDSFLKSPILRSKVFEQAVSEHKNIYELNNVSRETYNRCLDSFNAFGAEIDAIIAELAVPVLELEAQNG